MLDHSVRISPIHYLGIFFFAVWSILGYEVDSLPIKIFAYFIALGVSLEVFWTSFILNKNAAKKLRRPIFPILSFIFSFHRIWNPIFRILAACICIILLVFYVQFNHPLRKSIFMLASIITGYNWGARSIYVFVRAILVGKTRIIVFRRFSEEFAQKYRETILPFVGLYGYPICYEDYHLINTRSRMSWESGDLLGNVMATMGAGNPNWTSEIQRELKRVDFVVFDWSSMPSKAMTKELRISLDHLPLNRMVFIVSGSTERRVRKLLRSMNLEKADLIRSDNGTYNIAVGLYKFFANRQSGEIRPNGSAHSFVYV